jgi:hypothetical protein
MAWRVDLVCAIYNLLELTVVSYIHLWNLGSRSTSVETGVVGHTYFFI